MKNKRSKDLLREDLQERKEIFNMANRVLRMEVSSIEAITCFRYYTDTDYFGPLALHDQFRDLAYWLDDIEDWRDYSDLSTADLESEIAASAKEFFPHVEEACKNLISYYEQSTFFPMEQTKLLIREKAQGILSKRSDPISFIEEVLNLWEKTEFEENNLYFFLIGAKEDGLPSLETLKFFCYELIAYCEEMLIYVPPEAVD